MICNSIKVSNQRKWNLLLKKCKQLAQIQEKEKIFHVYNCARERIGGVETGSMYVQYVQGIQTNVPARTTFIEILDGCQGVDS